MHLRTKRNGFPRVPRKGWRTIDRPSKTIRNTRLCGGTGERQRSPKVPRNCRIPKTIHPKLCKNRQTPPRADKERHTVHLGRKTHTGSKTTKRRGDKRPSNQTTGPKPTV